MSTENNEKKKALEAALGQIEKQFGKGSIMKLGEFQAVNVDAIPTGALSLDVALGIGGVPRGRIIEIYGDEAVGKSTLSLHIVKRAIEQVRAVAYYQDVERVLTPEIIKGTQIDMKKVMRDQPETLEDVFDLLAFLLNVNFKLYLLFNILTTSTGIV